MMPNNILSSTPVPAAFLSPRDFIPNELEDWDNGPIALSDPTYGLFARKWKGRYEDGNVIYSATGVADQVIYTAAGITELSITFDQNGNPCFAYVQDGAAKMRWYDSQAGDYAIFSLAADAITPKVALDDKRKNHTSQSDIILAYIRSGGLYMRMQRDRFGVEYTLNANVGGKLRRIGMSINYRMQFEVGV